MFGLLVKTMHYVSGAHGGQRRQLNPLRLELELGIKGGSCGRRTSALADDPSLQLLVETSL